MFELVEVKVLVWELKEDIVLGEFVFFFIILYKGCLKVQMYVIIILKVLVNYLLGIKYLYICNCVIYICVDYLKKMIYNYILNMFYWIFQLKIVEEEKLKILWILLYCL